MILFPFFHKIEIVETKIVPLPPVRILLPKRLRILRRREESKPERLNAWYECQSYIPSMPSRIALIGIGSPYGRGKVKAVFYCRSKSGVEVRKLYEDGSMSKSFNPS